MDGRDSSAHCSSAMYDRENLTFSYKNSNWEGHVPLVCVSRRETLKPYQGPVVETLSGRVIFPFRNYHLNVFTCEMSARRALQEDVESENLIIPILGLCGNALAASGCGFITADEGWG